MRGNDEHVPLNDLRRRWYEWTAIIELFARGRRARRRVDPAEFQKLYKELLAVCGSLAKSAGHDEQAFFERLSELVRPWLTPKVLAQTDRDILLDLLFRCRQAARELGCQTWVFLARRSAPSALWALAVLGIMGIFCWTWGSVGHILWDNVRVKSGDAWEALQGLTATQWWLVGGTLGVLFAIVLLSRAARS